MATLRRKRDGKGDVGSQVESYDPKTGKLVGHEPAEGCALLVGSTAATFSDQDFWLATAITRIVSDDGEKIEFETDHSKYTFWR